MIQEESVRHNSIKMYQAHVVDRGLDSAVLGVTPSRYDGWCICCSRNDAGWTQTAWQIWLLRELHWHLRFNCGKAWANQWPSQWWADLSRVCDLRPRTGMPMLRHPVHSLGLTFCTLSFKDFQCRNSASKTKFIWSNRPAGPKEVWCGPMQQCIL